MLSIDKKFTKKDNNIPGSTFALSSMAKDSHLRNYPNGFTAHTSSALHNP